MALPSLTIEVELKPLIITSSHSDREEIEDCSIFIDSITKQDQVRDLLASLTVHKAIGPDPTANPRLKGMY